jgi:hypothetical protein
MVQAVLLWAVLMVALAAVGQGEILLVQVFQAILHQQHPAKEITAALELQMEPLALAVEVAELLQLVLMQQLTGRVEQVEMAVQG